MLVVGPTVYCTCTRACACGETTTTPRVRALRCATTHARMHTEIVTTTHKYQVGETVYYTSPTFGRAAATGSYTVVKLLPSESDDYQYRIKSSGEAFERVAKESQLERV